MSLKPRQVNFEETWGILRATISGVITLTKVNRAEWNDRFSDVYSLCVAHPEPFTAELYNETKAFLKRHVLCLRDELDKHENNSTLLKVYYDVWTKYSQGIGFLNQLYWYLNQQHAKKSKLTDADITYGGISEVPGQMIEIGELGLEIWRQDMLEKIQDRIIELVLDSIRSDRKGDTSISTATVNGVIQSFVSVEDPKHRIPGDPRGSVTFYERAFEIPFLRDTGNYYKQEADKLMEGLSVSDYMEKVIQKLHEEDMRARRYLHPSSYQKLSSECHKRLVEDHLSVLLKECRTMVESDKKKDLGNMYCLLKPVPVGLSHLAESVESHIRKEGLESVRNLKPETAHTEFVDNVMNVYKKYKEVVNEVFKSDQLFISALDKACTSIINFRTCPKTPCRSPELLARFCDSLLKKSNKGFSEAEVDERLNQSITIFRYIDDKDIFQKFYSRNLAKRLIHQLSVSMDAEEGMINRLKQACGYEFTNKLHRMFTDVTLSGELSTKFNDHLTTESTDLNVNFSILVLQAGAWPLQQNPSPFSIPQILEKSVQTFEAFYGKQFNGRKLSWLHHLSTCDVKISYTKKTYIIIMQTFQLAVIALFEKSDELTFTDLQQATLLNEDQLTRHIQSLLDCKLLECDDTEITKDSVVKLNKNYSNKKTKFRISAAVQKETPQEVEQTHVAVEEDRKIFMQAAIVRIMKSRKVIKHNVLIQEVLSLSNGRFSPSIAVIKKCIETLIERQYLERTPNSTDEYSYVA